MPSPVSIRIVSQQGVFLVLFTATLNDETLASHLSLKPQLCHRKGFFN